jgi:hypothetical protein
MGVRFPPGAPRVRSCHDAGTEVLYHRCMRICGACGVAQESPSSPCAKYERVVCTRFVARADAVTAGRTIGLVMEFDHVRGRKRTDVSTLVRDAASLAVVQAEVDKCVVRCANYHRRRTAVSLWGKIDRSKAAVPSTWDIRGFDVLRVRLYAATAVTVAQLVRALDCDSRGSRVRPPSVTPMSSAPRS